MQAMLLASFFETYGIWIILIVLLLVMFGMNFMRSKKADAQMQELESKLVPGTKVKTYSGFYGVIESVTETTDGKVVTLKIAENSYVDVDIRAIYGIDAKMTMAEYEEQERLNKEEQEKTETEKATTENEVEKTNEVVTPEVEEVEEKEEKTDDKE